MERMPVEARRERALRGVAAAAAASLIAATAHTLAGGGAPPWWLLLATTLLSSPAAVALIGRRASRLRTTLVVLAAQGLLHVAFATVGSAAPRVTGAHHATDLTSLAAGGHLHLDAGMIGAHVVAAVVTVVLLTHGERLLRAFARGLRRLLSRPAAPASRIAVSVLALRGRDERPRPVFSTVLTRRGPPALVS